MNIPSRFLDLFEQPAFGHLATVMADGTPQVTPVWVDFDGTHVIVNSVIGRVKDRNIRRFPHVALEIHDPHEPYRYLAVRGPVVEIKTEGADQHIDRMAHKYYGVARYPFHRASETRVMYFIEPKQVSWNLSSL